MFHESCYMTDILDKMANILNKNGRYSTKNSLIFDSLEKCVDSKSDQSE